MTDIDGRRMLDVIRYMTQKSDEKRWETLPEDQRANVTAVVMGIWQSCVNAAAHKALNADVIHDKFHIVSHLNEAVDQVRRQVIRRENKQLRSAGNNYITGTHQLQLFRERNLDEEQASEFDALKN